MAESIVKVPLEETMDYDYIAFSFNGLHSYDDFHIYRTSDGDRYNENLAPTLQDKTAEVPGGDGMYYFGSTHKQREFSINFAFDNMSEATFRKMKQWLNGKEMGDLWFSETPYKVWTAKVSGQPSIKYIPFDETYIEDDVQKIRRIYKGEGTVNFVAYWPYAHTPDFVQQKDGSRLDGNYSSSYVSFNNYKYFSNALPGGEEEEEGKNKYGDLPFHFVATLDEIMDEDESGYIKTTITVDDNGKVYSVEAEGATITEENGVYEVKSSNG